MNTNLSYDNLNKKIERLVKSIKKVYGLTKIFLLFIVEIKGNHFEYAIGDAIDQNNLKSLRVLNLFDGLSIMYMSTMKLNVHVTKDDLFMKLISLSKTFYIQYQSKIFSEHIDLYQSIIDELPQMIAVKKLDGTYVLSNKQANSLFNLPTIVGKKVNDIYKETISKRIYDIDQEVVSKKRTINIELEMYSDNGNFVAETSRYPIFNSNNEIHYLLSINTNISEKKSYEEKLIKVQKFKEILIKIGLNSINASHESFDTVINDSLKMVGENINANRVYVFDYDFTHMTASNTHEWCSKGTIPQIDSLQNTSIDSIFDWIESHKKGEAVYYEDVRLLDPNSQIYQILFPQGIISIITLPLILRGNLIGFVGFDYTEGIMKWTDEEQRLLDILAELIVNIKDKFQQNKELMYQIQRAEMASKAKGLFLANMSHEIKTPISGINNALNMLYLVDYSNEQLKYLDMAKVSIDSLTNIVTNILDLSKIERGVVDVNETEFILEDEILQIIQIQQPLLFEKSIDLEFQFDYDIVHCVYFDKFRLRQILHNIINNSIKFTHQGKISIHVNLLSETKEKYTINFSIEDTGIGISESHLVKILDPFYQVDLSTKKSYEGSGLGLSIINSLLKHFNTSVDIFSKIDHGTTVSFVLEMKKNTEALYQDDLEFKHKSMLIIQSNKSFHQSIKHMFLSLGMKVEVVYYFPETIDKTYDFICFYEDENIELIQLMKNKQEWASAKKIFIDSINLPQKCITEDNHGIYSIQYPFSRQMFKKLLSKLQSKSFKKQDTNHIYNMQFHKERVLVVDDNFINLESIPAILEQLNLIVTKAESGEKAIELIKSNQYSLVFMDIQMPIMDGFETTAHLRNLGYQMNDLPIIAVTATSLKSSLEYALEIGMNDYLLKPYDIKDLFEIIQKNIRKDKKTLKKRQELIFDESKFNRFFENRIILGHRIIHSYYEESEKILSDIMLSSKLGHQKEIKRHLHTLKGSSAYAAADRICSLVEFYESDVENYTINYTTQMIEQLKNHIEEWKLEIEVWKGKHKDENTYS